MKSMEKQKIVTDSSETATDLKEKGDAFFKKLNYMSAVNAYSEALRLDTSMITYTFILFKFLTNCRCLSNRSAAHLKLGNYQLCIDDCDYAISVLDNYDEVAVTEGETPNPLNKGMRSKLYFRKGATLLKQDPLKSKTLALKAYQSALQNDPKNNLIKQEVEKLALLV